MGILKTKILSYSPEQYYPCDVSVPTGGNLVNEGSGGSATGWTKSGTDATFISNSGPDGSGAWSFSTNSASEQYFRITSAGGTGTNPVVSPEITDADYSIGGWFRIPVTISGSTESLLSIMRIGGEAAASQVSLNLTGANIGKIQVSNPTTVTTSGRYDDGDWHYYAERYYFDGTNNVKERYLDGTLLHSGTASDVNSLNYFEFADNSISNATGNLEALELAHFYITPSSSIDATAIGQIWTIGSTGGVTNVTITETPATASATQPDATIAVTAGDHVEITTSIPVSAEFPSTISVVTQSNIEVHAYATLTATVEMIDNVNISTGIDASWSALEMTATATIVEPLLPVVPLTASATSGSHTVSVTPNYYSLIKSKNPYAYFYNGSASPLNSGYQSGTFTLGDNMLTVQDGGIPMNLIGTGKSWKAGSATNGGHYIRFNSPTTATSFNEVIGNGSFTIEMWVKFDVSLTLTTYNTEDYDQLFSSDAFTVKRYAKWNFGSAKVNDALHVGITVPGGNSYNLFSNGDLLTPNTWHQVVLAVSPSSLNRTQIQAWVDGTVVISSIQDFMTDWAATTTQVEIGGNRSAFTGITNTYFDEIALYDQSLSNSDIIAHYQFIDSTSPNRILYPQPLTADAESGDHNFIIQSNVNFAASTVTASSLIVNPSFVASKVINILATPLEASAANTNVTVKWGWTIYATPALSYAESVNAYRLSDVYYNYVQANVTPYRYVTFDGNNSYLDYGTDADYSVVPVAVGGTIVNPDLGINGKSAKTAGTSYATDGVILKESEYDDAWGTGLNNYHSSFWMQKSDDDTSTTGLRVLWNLNGYADNQHVVLYQYQNKLTLQFNNGSGTHISQSTVSNHNLFDGQRHFVAVAFDHTGANSYVNLFIDAADVMTVNLGTYNGTTVNGTTPVGPNDEANNHSRLSVGCLITPFAATALPVVPTNTKIYVDEVIWAKSSLTPTLATNLFNIMPVKGQVDIFATPLVASSQFVMPAISTNSVLASGVATATIEIAESVVYAELESVNTADIIDVSAELVMPSIFEDRFIYADVLVATAIFNDPGVVITIPGGPMLATVSLQTRKIFFSVQTNWGLQTFGLEKIQLSPWSKFIRSQDSTNKYPHALYGMKEIK